MGTYSVFSEADKTTVLGVEKSPATIFGTQISAAKFVS